MLGRCAEIAASMPEELTVQVGFVAGPDGAPVVFIVPTWCGRPEHGEARIAPFLKLGTLSAAPWTRSPMGPRSPPSMLISSMDNGLSWTRAGFPRWTAAASTSSSRRWRLPSRPVAPSSPTNSRAPPHACRRTPPPSGFVATMCSSRFSPLSRSIGRARGATASPVGAGPLAAFDAMALPGGYPNILAGDDPDRATKSYGRNAERLIESQATL